MVKFKEGLIDRPDISSGFKLLLPREKMDAEQKKMFDDFRDNDLRRCSTLLTKLHYASDADEAQDARDTTADHFAKLISELHHCECTRENIYKGALS